jgi:hypothetical protein
MIQCNAGHFYDEGRFSACPFCPALGAATVGKTVPAPGPVAAAATMPPGPDPNKTVPMRPREPEVQAAPLAGGQKTVVAYPSFTPAETEPVSPVVGWLVSLDGTTRGRDFRLHVAKNSIGREASNDVSLSGDNEVSRERHAEVIFEPNSKTFWLKPGDASGLVYLNGAVQFAAVHIKGRDVIGLGKTRLMLVPLVGEDFDWN